MKKPKTVEVGEPLIVARGLTLKMPFRQSYGDVDLDILRGELCAVVAENNMGKTELLLSVAGRMKPTAGTLTVAGWPLPRKRAHVRKMSGMGFFDRVNEVQPVLSVRSVVSAELNLYSRRSGRRSVEQYLEEWGFSGIAKTKVEELDRFTYVRLGIALGMVGDPLILIVDDVESDLTRHESEKLMDELKALAHNRGMTVVVACTDYDLALCADKVVPLSDWARDQERAVREKLQAQGGATADERARMVACTDYDLALCADKVVPLSDWARDQERAVREKLQAQGGATADERARMDPGFPAPQVVETPVATDIPAAQAPSGEGVAAPAAAQAPAVVPPVGPKPPRLRPVVVPSGTPAPPTPRGEASVGSYVYPEKPKEVSGRA